MLTEKTLEIVKCELDSISDKYEKLRKEEPLDVQLVGVVATYDRIGGRSTKISRPVEQEAIRLAQAADCKRDDLRWLRCVQHVFVRLMERNGKNYRQYKHDERLAFIMKRIIFEGVSQISLVGASGIKTKQRVNQLYEEIVLKVGFEAIERGLIRP